MKNKRISILLTTVFSCMFLSIHPSQRKISLGLAQRQRLQQAQPSQPWSATKAAIANQQQKEQQKTQSFEATGAYLRSNDIKSITKYQFPPQEVMKDPCALILSKMNKVVPTVIRDISSSLDTASKEATQRQAFAFRLKDWLTIKNTASLENESKKYTHYANQSINQIFNLLTLAKQFNAPEAKNCTIKRKDRFWQKSIEVAPKEELFRVFTGSIEKSLLRYSREMLYLASAWNRYLGLTNQDGYIAKANLEEYIKFSNYFATLLNASRYLFEAIYELVKELNPAIINKNFKFSDYESKVNFFTGNYNKNKRFIEAMYALRQSYTYYYSMISLLKVKEIIKINEQ